MNPCIPHNITNTCSQWTHPYVLSCCHLVWRLIVWAEEAYLKIPFQKLGATKPCRDQSRRKHFCGVAFTDRTNYWCGDVWTHHPYWVRVWVHCPVGWFHYPGCFRMGAFRLWKRVSKLSRALITRLSIGGGSTLQGSKTPLIVLPKVVMNNFRSNWRHQVGIPTAAGMPENLYRTLPLSPPLSMAGPFLNIFSVG